MMRQRKACVTPRLGHLKRGLRIKTPCVKVQKIASRCAMQYTLRVELFSSETLIFRENSLFHNSQFFLQLLINVHRASVSLNSHLGNFLRVLTIWSLSFSTLSFSTQSRHVTVLSSYQSIFNYLVYQFQLWYET